MCRKVGHSSDRDASPRRASAFNKASLRVLAALCLLGGLCLAAGTTYVYFDTSLDHWGDLALSPRNDPRPERIKIGVIGDSWVSGHRLDGFIREAVQAHGIPVEVVSGGLPGAKTRRICRELLHGGHDGQQSLRSILMDDEVDYLVVIAGVNDSGSHVGSGFYAHHMLGIIQAALARGMVPVIVEIPEYGIDAASSDGLLSRLKRAMYVRLFDGGKVRVIEDYRRHLREAIPASIQERITLVDVRSVLPGYHVTPDLYADPAHLNEEGNRRLGSLVGQTLAQIIIDSR